MIEISTDQHGPVVIMHFHGTLTREVLKDMEDAWSDEVDKMPDVIALDFRDVTQIDSISINHIFKMARIAENKKIKLIMFDVFESLKKIFEVIKLDKVITIMTRQQFVAAYLK
jgi:anti-anti-sigma factor